MKQDAQITLRISTKALEQLRARAKREDRSVNYLIRQIIHDYLEEKP